MDLNRHIKLKQMKGVCGQAKIFDPKTEKGIFSFVSYAAKAVVINSINV